MQNERELQNTPKSGRQMSATRPSLTIERQEVWTIGKHSRQL